MTLSEAFDKLQSGAKLTYNGLDGYIQLKDGKLVTELDAGKSFRRNDWEEVNNDSSKSHSESKRSRIDLGYDIDRLIDRYFNQFIGTWRSRLKGQN